MYIPFCSWLIFRKTAISTIIFVILFAAFFFITTTIRLQLPTEIPEEQALTWTTTVQIKGGNIRGFMKDANGRKIYVVYKFKDEVEKNLYASNTLVGQRFSVKGQLAKPSKPHHEFAFNMNRYLKSHRAIGVFEINELRYIDRQYSILTLLSEQRIKVMKRIEEFFPRSLVAEAKALLVGDQQDVEEGQQRAYQKLGITHLFAISGLHVALIGLLFQQLLLRIGVRKETVMILLVLALPSYGILAGGAPSVWRAVITVLILMFTQLFRHRITIESAISLCFILFVTYEPNMIYQIGFQLSFLATLAIILSANIIAKLKTSYGMSIWITFSCQLLVMPLLLYHFFEMSLSSFLMNLIFVPLFSYIILPINLILLSVSYFSPLLFDWLIFIYEPIRSLLTTIIFWLQAIPNQMWNPGRPPLIALILLLIVVLIVFLSFEMQKYRILSLTTLVIIAATLNFIMTRHTDLRVTFLSVGQGDSTLIELPNRKEVYLIDSGGVLRFSGDKWRQSPNEYEVGRQIIVPYLKGRGIKSINRLILTHADADHVEGAEEVMQEIAIKEIHISPNSFEESSMKDVKKEVIKQQIPVKEKVAGEKWEVNGVKFQYVMPRDLDYVGNNDSIVSVVDYEGYLIIIPGDLEKEGEAELVKYNVSAIENTTVLRSGHHGSKTSTSDLLLKAVNPQLIIHSNGLNNRYNHPAKEVVERIEEAGIRSFNTSIDGTIQLRITDEMLVIKGNEKYLLLR